MLVFKLLTTCSIVIAVLLIGVVLLQEPKDRIMVPSSSTAMQRIGLNPKADFLEKATWILASLLLGLTFLSAISLKYAAQSNLPVNVAKIQEKKASSTHADFSKDKTTLSGDQEMDNQNLPSDKEEEDKATS